MNKKVVSIGIVCVFLLTGFTSISAVGLKLSEDESINSLGNGAPTVPIISGPRVIKANVLYDYTFLSIDPEGDDVYYNITWGDGTGYNYYGPFPSGVPVKIGHTWDEAGTHLIESFSRDEYYNYKYKWAQFRIHCIKSRSIYGNLFDLIQKFFPNFFSIF
jgi:hypothetical protein